MCKHKEPSGWGWVKVPCRRWPIEKVNSKINGKIVLESKTGHCTSQGAKLHMNVLMANWAIGDWKTAESWPMLKFIGHRVTESQSDRHSRVLSTRVGEIFLCLISINSNTRFTHRRIIPI